MTNETGQETGVKKDDFGGWYWQIDFLIKKDVHGGIVEAALSKLGESVRILKVVKQEVLEQQPGNQQKN